MVIVNPEALDERLEAYHEADMEGMNGLKRMVRRSDGAVSAVLVNGRVAFRDGAFTPGFGQERGYGQFLPGQDIRP